MKINRSIRKDAGSNHVRFIMDIPVEGIAKYKKHYDRIVDGYKRNSSILRDMAEMVELIEEDPKYNEISTD